MQKRKQKKRESQSRLSKKHLRLLEKANENRYRYKVVLSGIFWKGPPEKILRLWDKGCFELLISIPVFAEYQEIAKRLSQKYENSAINRILEDIFIRSHLIHPTRVKTPLCDDSDDVMFLELAIIGGADYLVSGDKHLLKVGKYPGGEVVTASFFISLFP